MSSTSSTSSLFRHGHRLLQLGVGLILYASLYGVVIPALRSQRVGLSGHTLGVSEGILVIAVGLIWPRLRLGAVAARVAFWCLIYSVLAILLAYTMAAALGVGIETLRIAGAGPGGLSHGSRLEEAIIQLLAASSGLTGLVALPLVLWGLRREPEVDAR
jgi:hydroxylaminobenzene mutase